MVPAFHSSFSEMISEWEKKVSVKGACDLDVWPYLQPLSSDAISRTTFGSSYQQGKRIFELQKEQAELAIKVAMTIYLPGWRYLL